MSNVITFLQNQILSEKSVLNESWKRLFVYASIIGIIGLINVIVGLAVFGSTSIVIQIITIFLTGALFSLNKNRYWNALFCGVCYVCLLYLVSFIHNNIAKNVYETREYFEKLIVFIWIIIPALYLLPYIVISIISNLRYSLKSALVGLWGGILGCLIIISQNNHLLSVDNNIVYIAIYFFLFPIIVGFSINSEFIKFLFNWRGRINRIGFFISYTIIGFINECTIEWLIELPRISYPYQLNDFISPTLHAIYMLIFIILILVLTYANITLFIKRLHDINRNGLWLLLILVPIANIYLLILLLFKKGNIGKNKYDIVPVENNK